MKKEPIKAVLFDLDGTLLYTLGDIRASINVPLIKRGLNPISIEVCREIVGNGLRNAVKDSFEKMNYKCDEEEIDQALLELQTYYKNNPTKYCYTYDKINDFLKNLSIPFGLLSNKEDGIVKQIVPKLFKEINFDYVCGEKDKILKPDKTRVLEFCKQLNISEKNVLYVGDSEVDYNTAINANSQVLLVTWGYRDKEELLKFKVPTVDTVEELREYLNANR